MARKLTPTDCLKPLLLPSAYLNFTMGSPMGDFDVEGWTEMEWQILSDLCQKAITGFPSDSIPE